MVPAKPPCKKQKRILVTVESMKRDLTLIQMMSPVLVIQRKKEVTVCEEKKAIKRHEEAQFWNAHGREWVEIDHLTVDPAVNAYTGITKLKWGSSLEGAEKSMK